jgi:hypothetical protein
LPSVFDVFQSSNTRLFHRAKRKGCGLLRQQFERVPGATSSKVSAIDQVECEEKSMTYLDSCSKGQEGVAAVAHLENAAEAVFGQVANLEDLQLWGHGAEIELCDEDVIDDDWGLWRLIEGGGEQVSGALVEVLVGRERRPVEVESHGAGVRRMWQASQVGRHGRSWMISLPRRLARVWSREWVCVLDERYCGAHRIDKVRGDDDGNQVAGIMGDGRRIMLDGEGVVWWCVVVSVVL